MPSDHLAGTSKLEWVRAHYEETEMKCPKCGYVDDEGNWESEMNGHQVVYRHTCPSCEADRVHTFDLTE